MDIYQYIDSLMVYGEKCHLYNPLDYEYTLNALLAVLKLKDYKEVENHIEMELDDILEGIIEYAINEKIIENTQESKDLFDTKVMGVLTPKPSEIINQFDYSLIFTSSPEKATDYFYNLCKNTNYIRTTRISKDIHFDYESEYGTITISINMSKPEKDPNDIKKLLTMKQVAYPKCMLCKENVNYEGRIGFPARGNLRTIPVRLDDSRYYIQYSPYSYYNEHLICFHEEHFNMIINDNTIKELVEFVFKFPHYFIGSNADLPIVGGSILNHQHFQGGRAILPMQNAKEVYIKEIDGVKIYKLNWPLSVIRIRSVSKTKLVQVACKILKDWFSYKNEELNIINEDQDGRHNTITPICRMNKDEFEMDLVLRNNLTSKERPLGIYHPREEYWHIKKENIGLIEVMGLAILPSRLKKEMELVKKYLLKQGLSEEENKQIEKHLIWANNLAKNNDINESNVEKVVNDGVGEVFTKVLKDCAVFKNENQKEFDEFILAI